MADETWDAEYRALRSGAGVVDLGARTRVELRGEDRLKLLGALCTAQVDGLRPGQGRETFLANAKGKVLAHVFVLAADDRVVLAGSPGQAERIAAHVNRYILREDVAVVDATRTWGTLLLGGPAAAATLGRAISAPLPEGRLDHAIHPLGGHPVRVCRTDLLGAADFLLSVRHEAVGELARRLEAAGAVRCSSAAWEAARIESGWPEYGRDITEENFPQEVGRDALAVSRTKGCYLGQETIARIDSQGHVNRKLVGLRFDGERIPPAATTLVAGGKRQGWVTSAAFSPKLGAALAWGIVRREYASPGDRLESAWGKVEVVALPVVRA